jgi:hypothetical protein
MEESDRPTADSIKQAFVDDRERVLGWDDESLKRQEAARRSKQADAAREAEKRGIVESLRAWSRLLILKITGGRPDGRMITGISAILTAVSVLAVLAFMAIDRMGSSGGLRLDQPTARQSALAAGSEPGPSASNSPKSWLILASLGGPKKPQFTIELQGDGQTGPAVWLEPPGAKGAYAWNGDRLEVKLVLNQRASEGVYFDQHYNLEMTR